MKIDWNKVEEGYSLMQTVEKENKELKQEIERLNKEIERLNNIINELEKEISKHIALCTDITLNDVLDILKELKGSDKE